MSESLNKVRPEMNEVAGEDGSYNIEFICLEKYSSKGNVSFIMELQNNVFSGLLFEDVPHTKPDSLNLPRIFIIEFYCIII
jgi:hypothetical protein